MQKKTAAMPEITSENSLYAKNRAAWRKWLQQNHAKKLSVWLILYRKSSTTPSVYYEEAVEEALCFGWIDSRPNKRDAESYYLTFSPRKPKSVWSALNKKRIELLVAAGKMTAAGQVKIEQAKKDGSWNALDAADALQMPEPLKKALAKNKKAQTNFNAFPPSFKKGVYYWLQCAKTEATLTKRVNETVTLAAENKRVNEWKGKKQ